MNPLHHTAATLVMIFGLLLGGCELLGPILGADVMDDATDGSTSDTSASPDTTNTSMSSGLAAGAICEFSSECAEADAVCYRYGDGQRRCSTRCIPASQTFCDDGAFCRGLQDVDYGACASYGPGAEGDACADQGDCPRQMACVTVDGAGVCNLACQFGDSAGSSAPCPSGRFCQLPIGAGVSYGLCDGGPWRP